MTAIVRRDANEFVRVSSYSDGVQQSKMSGVYRPKADCLYCSIIPNHVLVEDR